VIIQSYLFPHHLVAYKLADIPRHLLKIASRAVLATLYIGVLVEQRVQDQNRITLSDKIINPLGLPAPHLHFEYHADDLALLQKGREMAHRWFDGLDAKHVEEIEVTWSRHHMGTCRMGTDPASSVVDENLCVHGMNNLYVGGCEAFVTGAGVPPTLTLCALSLRLADHLQQVAAQRQPDVTVNLSGQDPSTPLEPSEPVLQEA
jgi:choline dehydrogenase-like flavoprotein